MKPEHLVVALRFHFLGSITGRSSTLGNSTAAALTPACTVHHATPKWWATSATARPESIGLKTAPDRPKGAQCG
jgi:hypothetical protein